jgi:hypothetical protein
MKKILPLFIVLNLTLALAVLAACGDGQTEDGPVLSGTELQDVGGAVSGDPAQTEPEPLPGGDAAATGSDAATIGGDATTTGDGEQQDALPFALRVGDFLIEMDMNITYAITALGEPRDIVVQPSCAFDGDDRVYMYPDIDIFTYPVDDEDFIHTINLLNDNTRTTEGQVRVGDDMQKMLDAYGDDYILEASMYTFTRGSTTLQFFVSDGKVVGIIFIHTRVKILLIGQYRDTATDQSCRSRVDCFCRIQALFLHTL